MEKTCVRSPAVDIAEPSCHFPHLDRAVAAWHGTRTGVTPSYGKESHPHTRIRVRTRSKSIVQKRQWGSSFRGKQKEIVEAAIAGTKSLSGSAYGIINDSGTIGRDVFVLAPTGMGKVNYTRFFYHCSF